MEVKGVLAVSGYLQLHDFANCNQHDLKRKKEKAAWGTEWYRHEIGVVFFRVVA